MNKQFLKSIRDNMPEPLKCLLASAFRAKLVRNKEYIKYKKMLLDRSDLDENSIKEYQFCRLKEILIHSYEYVPYYNTLFKQVGFNPYHMSSMNDISLIPYLTRDIIRSNFDKLISTKKDPAGHYAATTGGSTGEPLNVLLDYDSVFIENAFVSHFRRDLGYQETDKLATFRGVEFGNHLWKYNPMQNELIFSPFKLSKKTILEYVKRINQYKPDFLNGYLSCIYVFAKLLEDCHLQLRYPLKGIFLISENIDVEQRSFIEKFFNAKSSTFYGHSERCIIAQETQLNEYVFDPYYGYTELFEQENGKYEIAGTGFLNMTMPLIRYRTNDICKKNENGSVSITGWRKNNFIFGINGEKISHLSLNFHGNIFRNVVNYQFVQTQQGLADLLLLVNEQFKPSDIEYIKKGIDKKIKDILKIEVKIVDNLILSPRGKFNRFIVSI
jgi:phenylacetate-coenzyme A ligase PaaK-like adenylate-forming protein